MREVVVRFIVEHDIEDTVPFLDALAEAWDKVLCGRQGAAERYLVIRDTAALAGKDGP